MNRQKKLWGEFDSPPAASSGLRGPPPSVSRDVRDFLNHYGSTQPSSKAPSLNLSFYQDKSPAKPSPLSISALQEKLRGNYDEVENSHSFIQWIFPIREIGMNWQSQPLEVHEIIGIMEDPEAMKRLLTSYEIMLDFYGMKLVNYETGQITRTDVVAPSSASWRVRYSNLLRNSHNFLRITRILKSNSEFGREHLNAGWLLFFLVEQARDELNGPSLVRSMDGYWKWCIRNGSEREWVVNKCSEVRKGGEWTEEQYIAALTRRKETGSFKEVDSSDID